MTMMMRQSVVARNDGYRGWRHEDAVVTKTSCLRHASRSVASVSSPPSGATAASLTNSLAWEAVQQPEAPQHRQTPTSNETVIHDDGDDEVGGDGE